MPDLTDDDRKFAREWASAQVPPVNPCEHPDNEWYWHDLPVPFDDISDDSLLWDSLDNEDAAWSALAAALAPIRRSLEPVLTAGLREEIDSLRKGLECGEKVREFGNFVTGLEAEGLRAEVERMSREVERWKSAREHGVKIIADLRSQREKANVRLAEREAAGAWRPIAEAPKDERVIVYCTMRGASLGGHDRGKDYGKHVTIAAFDTHYGFWIDGSQCDPEPTHWQPLPTPPPRTT